MVKLVEEIDKSLYSPMWEQVRKLAPWETQNNTLPLAVIEAGSV